MSEYHDRQMFARAEARWLEPPDQSFPPGVEDALDRIIRWPEGDDEDTRIPEFGRVTDYEEWEDEGEDGRAYGGVTLTIERIGSGGKCPLCDGRGFRLTVPGIWEPCQRCRKGQLRPETITIRLVELEDWAVPDELKPVLTAWSDAERAEQQAKRFRSRAEGLRRAYAERQREQA